MSGGGALNLSLLSRGIGEVQKNGHEKVEVFLEPSDYYNFAADRPYYLPPIQPGYLQFAETHIPRISTRSARDGSEIALPKTFTTRKGALLLFSEDMANKTNVLDYHHHHRTGRRHHPLNSSFSPHSSYVEDETDIVLKTVDDLAKSILEYGGTAKKTHDYGDDHKIYLKFIHRRREQWERQIRPGYSAKRYLSTWTRNWDDQVFESVVSKGYLTERSLFHYNLFLPNLRRHLFHEDLSNMPQPYRLMKNMLLTPGSLSGYTFYRGMPPGREFSALTEEDEESGDGPRVKRPDTKKSIRVIRTTKEGLQKEVSYSALDKDTQREVITDLLVKSAVHYALSKHEEVAEETVQQAIQSQRGDGAVTTDPDTGPNKKIAEFDMRSAVDSLLDTNRGGPITLGNDLPDDSQSQSGSEHTGSFKGGAVPHHAAKSMGARQTPRGSWAVAVDDAGKEYMGDVPVAAMRDVSTASSSGSSVPQLPPISRAPLSPIKDVSRETSQFISLPPIQKDLLDAGDGMPTFRVMPPTPQLTNLAGVPTPRSVGDVRKVSETDGTAAEVSGYDLSNESSPTDPTVAQTQRTNRRGKTKGPKVSHGENFAPVTGVLFQPPERVSHPASHSGFSATSTHPPIAGSNWDFGRLTEGHGHRTARSYASGSLDSKSIKGSMIMAPDGEIISVGGSVGPPRPHDVGVISDVTHQQRHVDAYATDESGMSDDEPDEWRAGGKKKKPRSMSSKLSDSIKRGIQKRESQSSVGSGIKSTVSSDKSEQYASSRGSIIIKKFSVASKDTDSDSLASGSIPSQAGRSSVTEQDLLDTLTTHAKRIADSVLSNREAGHDLEKDIRNAADVWMGQTPNDISRSHSVQGGAETGALEEIMNAQRANSAGPTTAEYKDLIRQSLTTAVARAAGLDPEQFPEDAEISPELLEALVSQKLTPDDIAIYHDEESGRPIIKSRQEIAQALGGVAEGHLYFAPNGKGGSHGGSEMGGIKRQMSIPADRVSLVDNMDYDVINYGGTEVMSERGRPAGRSKAGSKPGSIAGGTIADLKDHPVEAQGTEHVSPEDDNDEFKQRLEQLENGGAKAEEKTPEAEPVLPGDGSPKMQLDLDVQSDKSSKTGVSQKTEQSDDSKRKKKAKTPEEPFVVGMPKQKGELSQLYGAQGPGSLPKSESKSPVKGKKPKKDAKKPKGKKGKKDKEATPEVEPAPPAEEVPPPPPVVEEPPPPPPLSPKEPSASSSERPLQSSPEYKTDSEMEFNIVREEFSPEPDPPPKVPEEDELEEEPDEPDDDGTEEDRLKSISNKEARAAKRAAAATKRKEEVERRRKEREEQLKREKEEQERQDQLKREMETERRRREEERKLRKQREAEEAVNEENAMQDAERKKKQAEDRERRAKEDYQKKLEEMRRKQIEEEAKRLELLMEKQREEAERRAEEEFMMSQMAEQERLDYEKKKKEEEAERKKKEDAERHQREEEARLAMEEARRLAEEMARKQAELEARLKFNRALQVEASGMECSQDINRAFVFSYFELLQWLGLDIPEFELAKMTQL
ncbi:uncharacterized protein KIAA2012-like [Littorina saxatilis]|uniref:uncharacterized protein KIAA2012-like n=1 Tax=Littorina saxatilis TaxID=31220 RepID=UPI0038B59BA6